MPSLLKDEEYGLVKIRSELEIENLTEEEEIWMVQCPISVSVQLWIHFIRIDTIQNKILKYVEHHVTDVLFF